MAGRQKLLAVLALTSSVGANAQVPFDQAIRDLASADRGTRLRAAQLLKDAAYPEAAVPLATLITDPQDEVQLEAIAAELNIFLAEKIVSRRRIGFVVEVRNPVVAESAFSLGPLAIGPRSIPPEVLTALRTATRDDNPRVGFEALYAFGTLAFEPGASARRSLLRESGPVLAALVGSPAAAFRFAAVRVLGRVFARRTQDDPIEPSVGDAVITALNDRDASVRSAAMQALGAMRYERGVQALTDLFRYYRNGDLAEAALDALAHIAHPASALVLEEQLAAKNTALRGIAIEGFARLGDRARLQAIQNALAGERSDVTLLAGAFASAMLLNAPIEAIGAALGNPKLRDQAKAYLVELAAGRASAFARYLQDPDARLRIDAADALGLGGDAAAVPLVERLIKDPDPRVALAAERALSRLRRGTGRTER